jgi:hypothetical protein
VGVVGGGGCELKGVSEREWVLLCCNVNRGRERRGVEVCGEGRGGPGASALSWCGLAQISILILYIYCG